MTKELSNCCQAPIKATHGCDDDLLHGGKKCTCEIMTSWYECEKCKQPCDRLFLEIELAKKAIKILKKDRKNYLEF